MSDQPSELSNAEQPVDIAAEQVARVYATAFLGAANQAGGDVGSLVEELRSLVDDVFDAYPRLASILGPSALGHDERVGILDRVFGKVADPLVLNFLKVLSAHDRLNVLRLVVSSVERQFGEQQGRLEVEVTVPELLEANVLGEMAGSLRNWLGKEPVFRQKVDSSLLAGMILRVGDTVYDSSVKTQMEKLRKSIQASAVEKIQAKPESFLGS